MRFSGDGWHSHYKTTTRSHNHHTVSRAMRAYNRVAGDEPGTPGDQKFPPGDSAQCTVVLRICLIALTLIAALFFSVATYAMLTFGADRLMRQLESLIKSDIKRILANVDNVTATASALLGALTADLRELVRKLSETDGVTLKIGA